MHLPGLTPKGAVVTLMVGLGSAMALWSANEMFSAGILVWPVQLAVLATGLAYALAGLLYVLGLVQVTLPSLARLGGVLAILLAIAWLYEDGGTSICTDTGCYTQLSILVPYCGVSCRLVIPLIESYAWVPGLLAVLWLLLAVFQPNASAWLRSFIRHMSA